eukprot:scaffold90061_cov66-Phaeocystis_antarctica.AAC.6
MSLSGDGYPWNSNYKKHNPQVFGATGCRHSQTSTSFASFYRHVAAAPHAAPPPPALLRPPPPPPPSPPPLAQTLRTGRGTLCRRHCCRALCRRRARWATARLWLPPLLLLLLRLPLLRLVLLRLLPLLLGPSREVCGGEASRCEQYSLAAEPVGDRSDLARWTHDAAAPHRLEELLVLVDVEVVLCECAIERDVQCLHREAFRCRREWRVKVLSSAGRLHLR